MKKKGKKIKIGRKKKHKEGREILYTPLKYIFTPHLLSKPQNILFAPHSNTLLFQHILLTPHIQSLLKFYNLYNILKFYNLYNILKLILENLKKNQKIKNKFRICKSRTFGYIRILKSRNLLMIRKFKSGESLLYRKCKSENVQIIQISKFGKLLLRSDFKIRK